MGQANASRSQIAQNTAAQDREWSRTRVLQQHGSSGARSESTAFSRWYHHCWANQHTTLAYMINLWNPREIHMKSTAFSYMPRLCANNPAGISPAPEGAAAAASDARKGLSLDPSQHARLRSWTPRKLYVCIWRGRRTHPKFCKAGCSPGTSHTKLCNSTRVKQSGIGR